MQIRLFLTLAWPPSLSQTCVCANRFIVQEGIHDEFVAKLTAAAEGIVMGHGMEAGVAQGPLINGAGRSKVHVLQLHVLTLVVEK